MLHDLIIFTQQTLQQGLGEAGMLVLGAIGGGLLPRFLKIKTKASQNRQDEIDQPMVRIAFMINFPPTRHAPKTPHDAKENSRK